jgi:MoxR-like ATPase
MFTKESNTLLRERLPDGTLISIRAVGRELQAIRIDTGDDVTNLIRRWTRKNAANENMGLRAKWTKTGGVQFRQLPMEEVEREARILGGGSSSKAAATVAVPTAAPSIQSDSSWSPLPDDEIREFISRAMEFKPENLVISEIKWKYLIRSALRGKNILMIGPSGCGKTLAAQSVHKVFNDRPWFYFNFGASTDPRGMLIGNTHYDSDTGTLFSESLFARAIQTPGAICLMDEISRAHEDASNILMTVLDEKQRYLRIDEKPETPTIKVAEGVTFIGTANVGDEYTGTKVMDRALLDRFSSTIEMEPLSKDDEMSVLRRVYPELQDRLVDAIAEIADHTRIAIKSDDPRVSTIISTRMSEEMAALLHDGFSLADAAEVCVFPFYSDVGGTDSERTYMKQLVQKVLPTDFDDKDKPWDEDTDVEDSSDDAKVPWPTP